MLSADDEKSLVLSLEQADTDRKIDGHDPELQAARKNAIERVDDEDDDQVHMEHQYGQQRQRDIAHPDDWIVSLKPEEDASCVEEEGIEQDEDYKGNAIAIHVFGVGPIVASWVEVANHLACGGLLTGLIDAGSPRISAESRKRSGEGRGAHQ